ncbi:hypothetical protein AMECASPLE_037854 [Ameca splendens]|uniref:Uncharacterized protein n=1 Tax=Ameca splendens TaxID=208324 RepID=A0ABV0ZTW3_9TELE
MQVTKDTCILYSLEIMYYLYDYKNVCANELMGRVVVPRQIGQRFRKVSKEAAAHWKHCSPPTSSEKTSQRVLGSTLSFSRLEILIQPKLESEFLSNPNGDQTEFITNVNLCS